MNIIFLRDILKTISERGRQLLGPKLEAAATHENLTELAHTVLSNKGEASGIALADYFFSVFYLASDEEKTIFFTDLVHSFGPDKKRLDHAISAYQKNPDAPSKLELHAASEPRRQELFRRLNLAPGGTGELVTMREDLLAMLKKHPDLRVVDADLVHLFTSWFNRGFLVIKKIDWNTSATILEKIIQYEAVHTIHNWDELRRRINPADRHCYGFFHPALLDEPPIFVEVALTDKISHAIAPILSSERHNLPPEDIDTAIFYSISNCQRGLKGISFGNFLIKQVVVELQHDHPNLKYFATLSPLPGFIRWLDHKRKTDPDMDCPQYAALQNAEWWKSEDLNLSLKKLLMQAVAEYLVTAKANDFPMDPVARFHLGNGASLESINWLGDISQKGMGQSAGIMVNYLYNIDKIQENHERYATSGHVTISDNVQKLLTK